MSTNRIRLVVAYDGTDFCGWAAQTGRRTVQSTLTEAVRQVSGEEIEIIGASRTDSGAHALGQVCHFDCTACVPPEKWAQVLTKRLPRDIGVLESEVVSPDFNSRFFALNRWYRYRILTGPRDPLRARFAYDYGRPLDLGAMENAATMLVGRHDFRSYSTELEPEANAVRELFSVAISAKRDEVRIDIVGTAFVRGMMRRIAGALLEIGRGKRPVREIEGLLRLDPKIEVPEVLPARGLTLMRVRYGRHPRDVRTANEIYGEPDDGEPSVS